MVDKREYRNALGTFPTGVTIITARRADGECVGLTVNSFSSVSLDPPLVLWSLSRHSPNLAAFRDNRHFAINILAEHQAALSRRFATPIPDKFAGIEWAPGLGGVPLIADTAAYLECANEYHHDGGDHVILVGRVEGFRYEHRRPLVYCHGRYMGAAELQEGL